MLNFVHTFMYWNNHIICVLFFIFSTDLVSDIAWPVIFIPNFDSSINSAWLWSTILLIYYCILLSDILFRISASITKEIFVFKSLSFILLSCLMIMLCHPHKISSEIFSLFLCIGFVQRNVSVLLSLSVWKSLLVS